MSKDIRQYMAQTNARLMLGGILILLLVGDGLIYWFYGEGAAVMGLACLLAGLAPLALIWLALRVIEWIVQRANE